mmetsp:Transcript_7477/g.11180  ORF Transcript_7477/g.11180 Transcript_7477/m.11180 type:complete len:129 (-) Transcript_7477:43-429(-)
MASPMDKSPVQDMPPKGGYKPFNVGRELPKAKIRGSHLFLGTALIVCFGFYKVGQGNIERRGWKNEKRLRRAAMVPFLQAEEDVRYTREMAKYVDMERRIMHDVPGWVAGESVYKTRSWMPRGDQRIG